MTQFRRTCLVFLAALLPGQAASTAEQNSGKQRAGYMRSAGGRGDEHHEHHEEHHEHHEHHDHHDNHEHQTAQLHEHRSGKTARMAITSKGLTAEHNASVRASLHSTKATGTCPLGSDSCMHRVSRLRPHNVHRRNASFKIRQLPVANARPASRPSLIFQNPNTSSNVSGALTTVTCVMYVDDTLDAIYYNGTLIPWNMLTTPDRSTSVSGDGYSTTFCVESGYQFTFMQIPLGQLTILAHDSTPGTGAASCAGIAISCSNGLTTAGAQTFSDIVTPARMSPWSYYGYGSWSVRGLNSPLLNSPGAWQTVGAHTSTSTACGLPTLASKKVPYVQFWQAGYIFVAAQITGPLGPTTTPPPPNTTTTTIKAAAASSQPILLLLALIVSIQQ